MSPRSIRQYHGETGLPRRFCTLFADLGITNKSTTSLLFFYLTLVLSSPPCPSPFFLLSQTLWQIWQELSSFSSCSIRLQWAPGHSFFLGNDAADELARRVALVASSAIPCSLSPLISRIYFCLFSDWRRTVSSKFFDTQAPSMSTEELVLPRHARCVLSRLCCNRHSLLLVLISLALAKSRILPATPADTRPWTPLISFCTVKPRTIWVAHSSATLYLSTISRPDPGELPNFWGSMVFRHTPIPRKGSGKNNNNHNHDD